MPPKDITKHTFTEKVSGSGFCGHPYCNGRCYTYEQTCTCGYKYYGRKNKQHEIEHVLKEEGLYSAS